MKCAFIGHRDSFGFEDKVYNQIKNLIDKGITEFYSGGMGNFDITCEKIVKKLDGKLIFIAYNINQIKEIDKLWYDDIICPFGYKNYSKYDIPRRNLWIADHCDIFLCHVYKNGNAKNTLDAAVKKNKKIINIAYL